MSDRRMTVRIMGWYVVFLLVFISFVPPVHAFEQRFRNVIIMVPDGCGSTHTTIARWYKRSALSLDRMNLGSVRTYAANSLITDSAPAATAFATGYKTSDKFISVLPESVTMPGISPITENLKYKPVATVLEGAKLIGKSVGIVATSIVQHATPAAFSAHWPDRSNYNEIGQQQVYLGVDVVFGGGKKYLLPKEKGGARTDGEDLVELLRSRGYVFVENKDDMARVKAKKVWGIFADDYMAYELDRRKERPQEPGLADMTKKAIEILSTNPKGFFLLVEGSKIDWASHAHDPVGVVSETLAFDEAVGVALDFAKKNRQTLVLAFADHSTGGMSLGGKSTDKSYSKLPYEAVFALLKKATLTAEGVERMLAGDLSEDKVKSMVSEHYGINDLSSEEVKAIRGSKRPLNQVLGPMMSKRSHIGWTTTGHTGEDLFFYHYGYTKPLGIIENTDIARMTARAMGFDLKRTDNRLLVAADEAFKPLGATLSIDRTNPENQILVVEKSGLRAELPFGKNIMRLTPSGKEFVMEGITVFAPKTGRVYIPRQAVALFERAAKRK
jgi:alkaline phosphatase